MRHSQLLRVIACAASLALAGSAFALAEPPTMAELQTRINEFMQWYQSAAPDDRTQENMAAKLEASLEGIDFSELSGEGVELLSRYAGISQTIRTKVEARLEALADDRGPDGAVAAFLKMRSGGFGQSSPQDFAATAEGLFTHPGFEQAFRSGSLEQLPGMIGYFPEESIEPLMPHILGLANHFDATLPPRTLGTGAEYVIALHKFDSLIPLEKREAIRVKVLGAIRDAAEREEDARFAEWLGNQASMLESNFGKGLLINNPAPELYFTWSSDESIRTLEDLKGKVVVLDFWATWCGPCIASFPNIRDLQEHYKGYDVAIVGVTSIQGTHFPGGGRERIDVKGEPDREYELMSEFMKDHNMTWTVGFSQQEVFNPEYGVRGIPHVAIIDPSGKVRYNGLHPSGPLTEKAAKIDALLKEAGLKTPGAE